MARYSKMPESFTTATKSIMPKSTPSVLKSTWLMAWSKVTTWTTSRIIAPTMATSARCTFSDMMATIATTNTTTATICIKSILLPHLYRELQKRSTL